MPSPGNPQSFNRYSYVYNNPLKYTDPSGHCIFGLDTFVCAIAAIIGAGTIGYGMGRTVYEVGMQQSPISERIRRDQIGGTLVTNLSDMISVQAQIHSIDPTLISAVIRHEGAAIERRTLTAMPSSVPGVIANGAEYAQTLLQGGTASIGVGQMQLRRAKELEELGYVTPASNEHDRSLALLDGDRSVGYVAGMLHYLSDQLQTIQGFSSLGVESQQRLILIAYNWGWTSDFLTAINKRGLNGMIEYSGYDNQTLDEYLRWSTSQ